MNRIARCLAVLTSLLLLKETTLYAWEKDAAPLVQIALLLDTSNSMDGLIEQAKSQLWKIANDFAYSKRHGQTPVLEVALYEYGNDRLSPGEHYVRQVMPFSRDLDQVAQQLFALRTNGGSEYCGAVIKDALNGLTWNSQDTAYKAIFIAGNEPFTQGPIAFQESIASAVSKGIVVNPIFCGSYAEGVQTQWYAGALAGKGTYLNIDQNRAIVAIPTPYDEDIHRLGLEINQTYVFYGAKGREKRAALAYNDQMASNASASGALAERSLYKASKQYEWSAAPSDLASVVAASPEALDTVAPQDLPVELQNKSKEELKSYLDEQTKKRQGLQTRLTKLQSQRAGFLSKQQKDSKTESLDAAVQKTVRDQAAKKGFVFGR